jgi:hypothetical protein
MDTDSPATQSNAVEKAVPEQVCRPPPILLTSATNLIKLKTSSHSINCDENHERQVDARIKALPEAEDNDPPKK